MHLDHGVHAGPQPLGVSQKAPDFLPDLLLEFLGTVMAVVRAPVVGGLHMI